MSNNNAPSTSKNSDLFTCNITINGKLPHDLFEQFLDKEVNLLGIRGWIQEPEEGKYQGKLEGKKSSLEKLKDVVNTAMQFRNKVTSIVLSDMKKIDKYTYPKFEVKC